MYSRAIETRKKPAEKLPRSQRGSTRPISASATADPTPIRRCRRVSAGASQNSAAASARSNTTAT